MSELRDCMCRKSDYGETAARKTNYRQMVLQYLLLPRESVVFLRERSSVRHLEEQRLQRKRRRFSERKSAKFSPQNCLSYSTTAKRRGTIYAVGGALHAPTNKGIAARRLETQSSVVALRDADARACL